MYIGCSVFPFVVIYLMETKFRNRYSHPYIRHSFDEIYESLYENLKTGVSGLKHYQSLQLLRKMAFAYIVFFFMSEEWMLFQLGLNLILSWVFCLYIAHMQPWVDPSQNKVQLLNEFCYYMVSLLYVCFTDFNDNPEIKIYVGWVVVLVAVCNLVWPNLITML